MISRIKTFFAVFLSLTAVIPSLAFADSVSVSHICGYYTDSAGENCSYSSLVTGYTGGHIYRSAASFTTNSYSGTATGGNLVLGTSSDGTLCNSGSCVDWDVYLFDSSVTSGITWGTQPSSTLVSTCTSNSPTSNKITCDMSSLTSLAPSTTYYLQFRRHDEASFGDSYADNPAVAVMNYVINSSTPPTTTTSTIFSSYGLWGTIASSTTALITESGVPFWEIALGFMLALFLLFFIGTGLTRSMKLLLKRR